MSIVSITPYYAGQVNQGITRWKLICTDTLAQVTAPGFLNTENLMGFTISPLDIVDCQYLYTGSIGREGTGTYVELLPSIAFTGGYGVITLNQAEGNVVLPTIANQIAKFNDTIGTITDSNMSIVNGLLEMTTSNGLTAHAGGGQASALALTSGINNVTTVATANDSVKLPVSAAGMEILVINDSANAMQVFGAGTDTINDIASATGVSQLAQSAVLYSSPVAGKWYSLGLGANFAGAAGSGAPGIHSATASSTGATASNVVTDPAITAASIVIARFVSSANVVTVQTVLPAAGQFTLVTDTAPSTCVIEYISFTPSAALQNAGVFGGKGNYGGGSATFVISDPNIVAGMTVNANFQSQVTPSKIYTALAGNGTITFVCSANPGVCVMNYMAITPSPSLTAAGLYGKNYSYAGGFASIVISDANITASSIVTAEFQSQSVVALIQKVTPSAGTLTILASIDPGPSVLDYIATPNAGTSGGSGSNGALIATNNLSDLVNTSTARTNLGVVNGATAQVAMTAAQWNAMYATPFLLVAAPGANQMIIVDDIELIMTFVSAAYANGGVVAAQYDSTAHGAGVIASTTEAAADFFAGASTVFKLGRGLVLAPFSTCANKGLYLSNVTGAFDTGDSTWIIKVRYHVISTNS